MFEETIRLKESDIKQTQTESEEWRSLIEDGKASEKTEEKILKAHHMFKKSNCMFVEYIKK
jgi:hypothetical protein